MCNPMMLAVGSLAIGAGQAVVQHQQANAQYQAQEARYQENRMNAIRDFESRNRSVNMREAQENQKASEDRFQNNMEARAAMATNASNAASMNIYGNTVDALMQDIMFQEGREEFAIGQNQKWMRAQGITEREGLVNQTSQRIAQVPRGTPPNFGALALNIGSAALGAGTQYMRMRG